MTRAGPVELPGAVPLEGSAAVAPAVGVSVQLQSEVVMVVASETVALKAKALVARAATAKIIIKREKEVGLLR